MNKHTIFLALLILSAIIVRIIWSFWGASEYWGDGYHNIWIIQQTIEFGEYFDYKDRHLVWLPAYRLLLWLEHVVLEVESNNNFWVPFLLQLWYVGISLQFLRELSSNKPELFQIVFILFWPLPIIFGGFNMSEGLALCTITSIFYLVYQPGTFKHLLLIGVFAAITALTRHEATAFLGIYSMILFFLLSKEKAYSIVAGVILGLVFLSSWNWFLFSDPFFWLTSKFTASSSGASDFIESIGFIPRISEALLAILLVFPFAPVLFKKLLPSLKFNMKDIDQNAITVINISTLVFLLVFLVSSLFFFHGADPKYLLLVSFPCSLWTASIIKKYSPKLQITSISILILLVPIYALLFHIRSYNLELERRLGTDLIEVIHPSFSGTLWCDFPTTLVYANWNPKQVISSDQIRRKITNNEKSITDVLIEENIQYIIAADYDHSVVLNIYPEMNLKEPFYFEEIFFRPIETIDPKFEATSNKNASLFPRLASIAIERNKEIVVWKLQW